MFTNGLETLLASELLSHVFRFFIFPEIQSVSYKFYGRYLLQPWWEQTHGFSGLLQDLCYHQTRFSHFYFTYIALGVGPVALFENYLYDRLHIVLLFWCFIDCFLCSVWCSTGIDSRTFACYTLNFPKVARYSKIHIHTDHTQI